MGFPKRAKIMAGLAEAGRPLMWADENQAAILSGYSPDRFRREVRALELRGFPQVNALNGKRSIPAILAFWKLPTNDDGGPTFGPDERALENWDEDRKSGKRIARAV